ncbi:pentatricopeptide repeat-containing protein At3g29230-like [Dendrobium catenatum]|nr:pentatricopeptide repeat-containing protein At3g29230-like [Dendrobium catenatum]
MKIGIGLQEARFKRKHVREFTQFSTTTRCPEEHREENGIYLRSAMASSSSPNLILINQLLPILKKPRKLSQILQIHAQSIINSLLLQRSFASRLLFALSQLPSHSSSKSTASYAELIFLQIQNPNSFLWNTIIKIHAQSSKPCKAIHFFIQMRRHGVDFDDYTYPFVLSACSSIPGLEQGIAIHGELLKRGVEADLFVRNCLITLYCRNGEISLARKAFDGFEAKDLVSWNSMMAGYAGCGQMVEAQKLFDEMPERDNFSWAILIDGYGKRTGNVERAQLLFDELHSKDIVIWNSIINCYAGAGNMSMARELFDKMPKRNVISWSILIDGHVRHGDPKEALILFQQMLRYGTKPDRVAALGAIASCAQLGALDQGCWVHSYLKKNKFFLDDIILTALIDMYMKCGSLEVARRLFEKINNISVVAWNVMIVGLGINGHEIEAVEVYHRMIREGAFMDDLTFLGVLTACSHGGLVSEAMRIFSRMRNDFMIEPKLEHYGCLVDLLGRAGRLTEAFGVIKIMPMEPTATFWGSLLAACRKHRCVELAELSVRKLVSLGADDCGVYVLMSNVYADKGMWDDVWRMRRLISERGMNKEIGRSVVEVDGIVQEFVSGDCSHLRERIYEVIWSLSLALDWSN